MKKKFALFVILGMAVLTTACGTGSSTEDFTTETTTQVSEKHIYDDAQIKDILDDNGDVTGRKYSSIVISKDEVTEEALNDWYFNYVTENEFEWAQIVCPDDILPYDQIEAYGGILVYSNNDGGYNSIIIGMSFKKNEDGNFVFLNLDDGDWMAYPEDNVLKFEEIHC